jgi:plastocyanin
MGAQRRSAAAGRQADDGPVRHRGVDRAQRRSAAAGHRALLPGLVVILVSMAALASGGIVAVRAAQASVQIAGFSFNPSTVTVQVGDTVTWTNMDGAQHTVTADGGAFDSGPLSTGQQFSFTATTAGTFAYHCAIHPNMRATLVVQAAAAPPTSTPLPTATPTREPEPEPATPTPTPRPTPTHTTVPTATASPTTARTATAPAAASPAGASKPPGLPNTGEGGAAAVADWPWLLLVGAGLGAVVGLVVERARRRVA